MSKFDDFIDEFVFMAKNAAGVASKKTEEVVEISKLKYQIKQAEWDLEKAYAKLGAIVYESKRSSEDFSDAILLATSEIDDLKQKAAHMEDTLRTYRKVKKCAKCGQDSDSSAAFCVHCGAPLEDDPIPVEVEVEPDSAPEEEKPEE